MALNLCTHKAVITDGGGTRTLTEEEIRGLHNIEPYSNIVTVSPGSSVILHYDLTAQYNLGRINIYVAEEDASPWTIQVSSDDATWTGETLSTDELWDQIDEEWRYSVYSDVDDAYRYVKLTCEVEAAGTTTHLREVKIQADQTKMYFSCAPSDRIGSSINEGTYYDHGSADPGRYRVRIDTENPAPADGYLYGIAGFEMGSTKPNSPVFYILREVENYLQVIDTTGLLYFQTNAAYFPSSKDHWVCDPPLRFQAGDYIGIEMQIDSENYPCYYRAVSGGTHLVRTTDTSDPFDWSTGTLLDKSDFVEADQELRLWATDSISIQYNPYNSIPIADRYLTGIPGDSNTAGVVNQGLVGTSPEVGFYPYTTTLAANIDTTTDEIDLHWVKGFHTFYETGYDSGQLSDIDQTVWKGGKFPPAGAGSLIGGEVKIGDEKMTYTYISGKTLKGVTRGVRGTVAACHFTWDKVMDVSPYIEISLGDGNWYGPGDDGWPLSLGDDMVSSKTFYVRANLPYEYQDDKEIKTEIYALWGIES